MTALTTLTIARGPHPDDCRDKLRALGEERATWPERFAAAALEADSASVPVTEMAQLVGVTRATVYRALPPRARA